MFGSTLLIVALAVVLATQALAASEDLGNGFEHHGVATPVSNHRGIVSTADGNGRDVALAWLFDHTGGYALLMIDAETGKSEQFPMPFPSGGDCPYSSILSSANKFYTHFGGYFCEFDPVKRAFTFNHKTAPQMAMSMTEDDNGVIWSASYPQCGLVSYNPKSGEFKDYGQVYKQNWQEYPRYVAADDKGWIYAGIGNTNTQIIALNPRSGEAKPVLAESERVPGAMASVYRDQSGKVYGCNDGKPAVWVELYEGKRTDLPKAPKVNNKPYITSSQGLFHQQFPDGKVLKRLDLTERKMTVQDPAGGKSKTFDIDYTSEGAHLMGMCAAPDGTMVGGTAFPMRFFSYSPDDDTWVNRESFGQWNTVGRQGDRYFVGAYSGGHLLEWDPSAPWVPTVQGKPGGNPAYLFKADPEIGRPHKLLCHRDGKTVIMAGTPEYGWTGGGLLFYDRETQQSVLLKHTDILQYHSTFSLLELPRGRLLGGTTIAAGTGGEVKAKEAEMYIMDMATKQVLWHKALFPGVKSYCDLTRASGGLVYGVADSRKFFVFDPRKREVVYEYDADKEFGPTNGQQGPRIFVNVPGRICYMLFQKGIVQVEPRTFKLTMVAESPVPIGPGGDYLKGRIYFGSGSHVYSWQVPKKS